MATIVLRTSLQQASNKLLVPEQVNQRLYINRSTKSLDIGAAWLGKRAFFIPKGVFTAVHLANYSDESCRKEMRLVSNTLTETKP
jgi:hypothetical protein